MGSAVGFAVFGDWLGEFVIMGVSRRGDLLGDPKGFGVVGDMVGATEGCVVNDDEKEISKC